MRTYYRIFALLLAVLIPFNGYAIDFTGNLGVNTQAQKEYTNTNPKNRILIEVNAVSGVNLSGVHKIPDTTNLVEFITLAGGPLQNSDPSEVLVKRRTKSGYQTLEYDLEDLVSDPNKPYPLMKDGDVLLIEKDASVGLLNTLSIVGITLGIIASGFLIRDAITSD